MVKVMVRPTIKKEGEAESFFGSAGSLVGSHKSHSQGNHGQNAGVGGGEGPAKENTPGEPARGWSG